MYTLGLRGLVREELHGGNKGISTFLSLEDLALILGPPRFVIHRSTFLQQTYGIQEKTLLCYSGIRSYSY